MGCVVNSSVSGNFKQRRMEFYSGVSDGAGNFSATYPTPFIKPMMMCSIAGNDTETQYDINTTGTTGFQITCYRRALLTVLGINLLSFATTPVSGIAVQVFIIEGQD